jgi:RNA-directed DNA polymerase
VLVPESTMRQLDLEAAAKHCLDTPLDRLPPLIADRALTDASQMLVRLVRATFLTGTNIATEVITMPKNKFGQRPIIYTPLASRILYQALVAAIKGELGLGSREGDAWVRHEQFAIDALGDYVVQLDIAACYEFIDHERLRQEIISLTLNHSAITAGSLS